MAHSSLLPHLVGGSGDLELYMAGEDDHHQPSKASKVGGGAKGKRKVRADHHPDQTPPPCGAAPLCGIEVLYAAVGADAEAFKRAARQAAEYAALSRGCRRPDDPEGRCEALQVCPMT